jgi:hypothetical protein
MLPAFCNFHQTGMGILSPPKAAFNIWPAAPLGLLPGTRLASCSDPAAEWTLRTTTRTCKDKKGLHFTTAGSDIDDWCIFIRCV